MVTVPPDHRAPVRAALAALGVKRLLVSIHDASFPADPDEDTGAGTPSTRAARRLLELVAGLGFTGVQLGPQGETSRDNPSPYDGTIFSRSVASISLDAFAAGGAFEGLAGADALAAAVTPPRPRADHRRAHDATHALVAEAWTALAAGARPDIAARLAAFRAEHAWWLERDALFAALQVAHGRAAVQAWPEPDRTLWLDDSPARTARRAALAHDHAAATGAYALGQLIAHDEHDRVRAAAHALDLALFADLQVGFAEGDAWSHVRAFLPGYLMGAPPSRTTAAGQPWNYPVLDPGAHHADALALVRARADKTFASYDGVRIDHPHGLVCPWVYRAGTPDSGVAVREGARLHEAPDLPDHADLAAFAFVRPDQLDRALPRYADGWVRALEAAQVERYAGYVDAIVAAAQRAGRTHEDLSCEVLSTLPLPLRCVLARHQLGRWRVLQKADLAREDDVYRCENAAPEDWVMLGNHDTPGIFALIRAWDDARRAAWARHVAARLGLAEAARDALAAHPGLLAAAMLAEMLASPAENAMIFFADLFGYEERYNVPGTFNDDNWSLRLPSDAAGLYVERVARGAALDLPLAAALAVRARGGDPALVARLAALAHAPLPAALRS